MNRLIIAILALAGLSTVLCFLVWPPFLYVAIAIVIIGGLSIDMYRIRPTDQ